jgi:hypothetical protein
MPLKIEMQMKMFYVINRFSLPLSYNDMFTPFPVIRVYIIPNFPKAECL